MSITATRGRRRRDEIQDSVWRLAARVEERREANSTSPREMRQGLDDLEQLVIAQDVLSRLDARARREGWHP